MHWTWPYRIYIAYLHIDERVNNLASMISSDFVCGHTGGCIWTPCTNSIGVRRGLERWSLHRWNVAYSLQPLMRHCDWDISEIFKCHNSLSRTIRSQQEHSHVVCVLLPCVIKAWGECLGLVCAGHHSPFCNFFMRLLSLSSWSIPNSRKYLSRKCSDETLLRSKSSTRTTYSS